MRERDGVFDTECGGSCVGFKVCGCVCVCVCVHHTHIHTDRDGTHTHAHTHTHTHTHTQVVSNGLHICPVHIFSGITITH